MSITHEMMLLLDRSNQCLVCKVPLDIYTRHKNLDDFIEVANGRTVRTCLQQVLDVSLAGLNALWLCNKCYSDLEEIQVYYNLVKHFRERFHNAVNLTMSTATAGNTRHQGYSSEHIDGRTLEGQGSQNNNNPNLLLHTSHQDRDLWFSAHGVVEQGTGNTTATGQSYVKYKQSPPPSATQQRHQQQEQHGSQQQHRPQHQQHGMHLPQEQPKEHKLETHQLPQNNNSQPELTHQCLQQSTLSTNKVSEGSILDSILDLPSIEEVEIKKEVEADVEEPKSDDEDGGCDLGIPSSDDKPDTVAIADRDETRPSTSASEGGTRRSRRSHNTRTRQLNEVKESEPIMTCNECSICGQVFKTGIRLKRHMLTHKRNGPFKCSICTKGFTSETRLKRHTLCHAIDGEAALNLLDNSSESIATDADSTESSQIKPKGFPCCICHKSFAERRLLRMHKRAHTLEKYSKGEPMQCPDCDVEFPDIRQLKQHIIKQACDWPWKCHLCEAGFVDEAPLKRHLKRHANESLIICTVCGKRLADANYMKEHLRIHTGELPHKCTFCKKGFNNPSNLKQHERIHTGEKPYKCKVCGMEFRQIGQKKVHELAHTGKAPYICPTCGREFFWACSYKKHLQIHTDERPELCSICGKSFRNIPALHAHARSHSDYRPHMCSYCGKGFKTSKHLAVHKRIHTGERPFVCKLCGRGFTQATGLKFHLRSHGANMRLGSTSHT